MIFAPTLRPVKCLMNINKKERCQSYYGLLDCIEWHIAKVTSPFAPHFCVPFESCTREPDFWNIVMLVTLAHWTQLLINELTWDVFQRWHKFDEKFACSVYNGEEGLDSSVNQIDVKVILGLYFIAICCLQNNWRDKSKNTSSSGAFKFMH